MTNAVLELILLFCYELTGDTESTEKDFLKRKLRDSVVQIFLAPAIGLKSNIFAMSKCIIFLKKVMNTHECGKE